MTEIIASRRSYAGVTTKQIIVEMLTENTGHHMLDSGGAYGRNFEANQGKDFDALPPVTVRWDTWKRGDAAHGALEMDATVSLYHWMLTNLEFDPEMQERLDQWADEHPEDNWLVIQEGFAKQESRGCEPQTINTYNDTDSCDLSQAIQYAEVYTDDEPEPSHLVVSVHGGCDIRGGYTAPKCFKVGDYYEARHSMGAKDLWCEGYSWSLSGYNYVDANHDDDAPELKDPFALPCFDTDWVETEDAESIRATIARADSDMKALDNTTLNEGQKVAMREAIRQGVETLEKEMVGLCIETLAEQHDYFIVVRDKRAFLFTPEIGPQIGEDNELHAGNIYL